jgi:hypothetical protein
MKNKLSINFRLVDTSQSAKNDAILTNIVRKVVYNAGVAEPYYFLQYQSPLYVN